MQTKFNNPKENELLVNRADYQRKRKLEETTSNGECSRCGKTTHNFTDIRECPAFNKHCLKCGRRGHFSLKYRTKKAKFQDYRNTQLTSKTKIIKPGQIKSVNQIEDPIEFPVQLDETHLECFNVERSTSDDIIEIKVGGVVIQMLIDSGSSCNIICGRDWKTLLKNNAALIDIQDNVLHVIKPYASTEPLHIQHKFTAPVAVNKKGLEIIQTFMVVQQGTISLLGKKTALSLGVLRLGLTAYVNPEPNTFPKIKDVKVKLTINPNIKPIQQPVRRVPIAIEEKVECKLDEALTKDIIERVNEPSAWISPMVIVFKPDGDIRVMRRIDMRA